MKHRATFLCTPEAVSYLCGRFGFGISDVQAILLAEYLELLMKWNRVMNLVGTRSWEACLESLISDSLHLARYLECLFQKTGGTVPAQIWDFGAGAGLPAYRAVSSGSMATTGLWKRGKNAPSFSPPHWLVCVCHTPTPFMDVRKNSCRIAWLTLY